MSGRRLGVRLPELPTPVPPALAGARQAPRCLTLPHPLRLPVLLVLAVVLVLVAVVGCIGCRD